MKKSKKKRIRNNYDYNTNPVSPQARKDRSKMKWGTKGVSDHKLFSLIKPFYTPIKRRDFVRAKEL